jgi:hypothetical protein
VATIRIRAVWDALDECAKGWTRKESDEYWTVLVPGKEAYPVFPLGKHGPRTNPEIRAGEVRSLARFFDIVDCFKRNLPSAFQ